MKAYVFPGQGTQCVGMGKALYAKNKEAKELFEQANDLLGFRITDLMFFGTEDDLKQTRTTQPSIFLESVVKALTSRPLSLQAVAGHSLGEFSALVVAGALSFQEGLFLVKERAAFMQEACEAVPSTMVVVLGMAEEEVASACREAQEASGHVVVLANCNAQRQQVISGDIEGVEAVVRRIKEEKKARVLPLPVGGAFHSPLMKTAEDRLSETIASVRFAQPTCPIYQNYSAQPTQDVSVIKENLVKQLTAPVLWRQLIQQMAKDGYRDFVECGPKSVLAGLTSKIDPSLSVSAL